MSEMSDLVAKAIYHKPTRFDGDPIGVHLSNSMMIEGSARDVEELRRFVMEVCEDAAQAAIEVMRKPTDEMESAGWEQLPDHPDDWSPVSAYQRMIEAALK